MNARLHAPRRPRPGTEASHSYATADIQYGWMQSSESTSASVAQRGVVEVVSRRT